MNKTLLLASFVPKEKLEWFKTYLHKKFELPLEKIFIFQEIGNDSSFIITFKIVLEKGEKFDIKRYFRNTILIHKKGSTLYTINALNRIIELENNLEKGNIDYKSYKIDWKKLENTFIINKGETLISMPIKRIFP